MPYLTQLGDRNYLLLSQAFQHASSDDKIADSVLAYSFEEFYCSEYDEIKQFTQWLLDTGRSIGRANYEIVFGEWLRSQGRSHAIDGRAAALSFKCASPSWLDHFAKCLDLIEYAGETGKAQGRAELLRLAALMDGRAE